MQSADYVPGVSGWKIHDHVRLELNDGNRRINAEVKLVTTAGPGQTNDEVAQMIRDLKVGPDAEAVTALTSRVASQDASVRLLSDGYVTGEKPARQAAEEAHRRAEADMAIAQRIGSVQTGLSNQGAAAVATSTLTSRVTAAEEPILQVDPGKAIEPLRLGKVTFYGESARVIRAAQAVLESAGAGQLEVVKREPFKITADGQVFISEALLGKAAIQKAQVDQHSVMPTEQPKPRDATEILDEICRSISESELGKDRLYGASAVGGLFDLKSRLKAVELSLTTRQGQDDAAKALLERRLDDLQNQITMLIGKAYG